jgi:hypothetical protein
MRKYLAAVVAFLLLISTNLFALHRDYKSDCDEKDAFQEYYEPYCLEHAPNRDKIGLIQALLRGFQRQVHNVTNVKINPFISVTSILILENIILTSSISSNIAKKTPSVIVIGPNIPKKQHRLAILLTFFLEI